MCVFVCVCDPVSVSISLYLIKFGILPLRCRPEVIDPAMLRPGRFGKLLYVPLPGPDDRGLILKALSKRKPINPDVDLSAIGKSQACENLSGADLKKLVCLLSYSSSCVYALVLLLTILNQM